MPQLETSSWFMTSMWTWISFITLPLKIMSCIFASSPDQAQSERGLFEWSWTW